MGLLRDKRGAAGPCAAWGSSAEEQNPCTRVRFSLWSVFGRSGIHKAKSHSQWGDVVCVLQHTLGTWLQSLSTWLLGHTESLDCTRSLLSSGWGGKVELRSMELVLSENLCFLGSAVEKVNVMPFPLQKLCVVQLILNISMLLLFSLLHSGLLIPVRRLPAPSAKSSSSLNELNFWFPLFWHSGDERFIDHPGS